MRLLLREDHGCEEACEEVFGECLVMLKETPITIDAAAHVRMDDLEMTRLCAEAMGLECGSDGQLVYIAAGGLKNATYMPLKDDAQAMALVKQFSLQISRHCVGSSAFPAVWLAAFPFSKESNFVGHHTENADLNRAIVECVAKMQRNLPR